MSALEALAHAAATRSGPKFVSYRIPAHLMPSVHHDSSSCRLTSSSSEPLKKPRFTDFSSGCFRGRFGPDQSKELEDVYVRDPFPDRRTKRYLAQRFNRSEKSINVWFQNKRSKDRRLGNHIPEAKNKDHSDGESDTMSLIHDSRSKFPHSRFNAPDVVSLSMDSGFPSPSILSTSQVLSATTNCPSVALSTISLRNSPASSVLDRPDVSLLETMSLQTSSSSSSFGFSQSSYSLSSILEGGSVHLPSIKDPLPLQKKNEGKELDSETEENEDAREECESGSEVFRVLPSFGDLVSSLPRKRASMVHSSLPKLPLSLFFPHPFVTASK